MKQLLILAVLPAALALGACESKWEREGGHDWGGDGGKAVELSGKRVARTYDLKGFTSVELMGPDDVEIRHGDAFSVRAEGDSAVLDALEFKLLGNELKVSRKSGFRIRDGGDVKILVTLPKLTAVSSMGPGDMTVDRGDGDFSADLKGPGDIRVGSVSGGNLDLDVMGPGTITISGGTAADLDASIMGPGDIDARGVTAAKADVSITGPGDVDATVKGPAKVSIMGPGSANIGGGAQCSVTRLGPGNANCS